MSDFQTNAKYSKLLKLIPKSTTKNSRWVSFFRIVIYYPNPTDDLLSQWRVIFNTQWPSSNTVLFPCYRSIYLSSFSITEKMCFFFWQNVSSANTSKTLENFLCVLFFFIKIAHQLWNVSNGCKKSTQLSIAKIVT